MSHEQDIYNELVRVYPGFLKPMTDISRNTTGNKDFVGSAVLGFDFDLVYNLSPSYKVSYNEKSPDALFCVNDKLFFVEFKEGRHKKIEIRSKIHEGILTLYMFVKANMPLITKEQFCNLKICYALVSRKTQNFSSVALALLAAAEKHQLKNMEGFLLEKTYFTVEPSDVAKLLKGLTGGALTYIDYYDASTSMPARINA